MDDLVADVELDLALEDVERVGVPLVEVGVDAASRVERDLEQRELGAVGLDGQCLRRDRQCDRLVHSDRLLDEALPLSDCDAGTSTHSFMTRPMPGSKGSAPAASALRAAPRR